MIRNHNNGFTLIELLVVVLIIGILAAMALPQYFKAVERSRMGEAVTLMANIAGAQQRKYLQINKYTKNFQGLDVAPKGATSTFYDTKGEGGNGFRITLNSTDGDLVDFGKGDVTAERRPTTGSKLQYAYTLHRYYAGSGTACKGGTTVAANESDGAITNGSALCADFCGLDDLTNGNWCCSDGGSTVNSDVSKLAGACTKPTNIDGVTPVTP